MASPRLQHASLLVPPGAQDAVRAFYGGLLGLEEKEPPRTLAHRHLVWFSVGEGEMELHFLPTDERAEKLDQHHICLVVDDLEAYRRRLIAANVTITEDVAIPFRPRFFCRDPFGNLVELTMIQGDYRTAQ